MAGTFKNRPRKLVRDIIAVALAEAKYDYPESEGYEVNKHDNEIWINKRLSDGSLKYVMDIRIIRL